MDNNGEPYDLVTVLSRLEDLKGVAQDIGRHSNDDNTWLPPPTQGERVSSEKSLDRYGPGNPGLTVWRYPKARSLD